MKIDKCNPLSIRYLREINEYMDEEKKTDPEQAKWKGEETFDGVMVDREYLSRK